MRPVSLVMNAFGPFARQEKIDFSKLYQQNIFVITGRTGAGKTTIFDAICFALYGKASGSLRDSASFKSDHAAVDAVSFVEFTFLVHEKLYTVKRQPKQHLLGRGGKIREMNETVSLLLPDNQIITSVREVNQTIEQLLGMNAQQFGQIVMLAQGEFRKMIESKSNEKQEIFRKLFNTDLYKNIHDNLKKQVDVLTAALEQNKRDIKEQLGVIRCDNENTRLSEALSQEYVNLPEIITCLSEQITQDAEYRQKLLSQKEVLSNILSQKDVAKARENNQKLLMLEQLTQKDQSADEQEQQIEQIKQRIIQANVARELALLEKDVLLLQQEEQKAAQVLEEEQKALAEFEVANREISWKYDQIEQLKQEQESLVQTIKLAERQLEILLQCEQLSKQVNSKQQQVNQLDEQLKLEELLLKRAVIGARERELHEQMKNLTDLIELGGQLKAARVSLTLLQEQYKEEHARFIRGQAGVLAQDLQEEQPCPVCGSLTHPQKAVIQSGTPTQERMEQLQTAIAHQNAQAAALSLSCCTRYQSLTAGQDLIDEQNFLNSLEDLKQQTEQTRREYAACREELLQQNLKLSRMGATDILDRQESEQDIRDRMVQLRAQKSQLEQTVRDALEARKQLIDRLPEQTTVQQLRLTLEKLEGQRKLLGEEIETIISDYVRAGNNLSEQQGKLVHASKNVQRLKEQRRQAQERFAAALSQSIFENQEAYHAAKLADPEIRQMEEDVNRYILERDRVKQKLQALQVECADLKLSDIPALEQECAQLSAQFAQIDQEIVALAVRNEVNQRAKQRLTSAYQHNRTLSERFGVVGELYRLCNGDNPQRINFENFVLAGYFNDIVAAANVRLTQMTEGRYILRRRGEREKNGRQSGLDLEIFDSYTGKCRHINTLSGGEGFQASLALALGLSDAAQAYAGGIHIETMFIDEGFGTLDSQSLDSAVDTLMRLRENGRLVGIISHIPELKSRIPARIEVERSLGSSTIRVVS